MVHLLSSLFFIAALVGIGAVVVETLRLDGAQILAALLNEAPPAAARPWQSRVRTVASPRPVSVRLSPRRAAA
jgi:hypothetical protein